MYPFIFTTLTVLCVAFNNADTRTVIHPEKQILSDTSQPDVLRSVFYKSAGDSLLVSCRLNNSGNVELTLTSLETGQIKFNKTYIVDQVGEQTLYIPMRDLSKGNYVLNFRSRSRFSGKRLVVKN